MFSSFWCNEIANTLLIPVYLFSNGNDCVQITDSTEKKFIFHIFSRFHKGELAHQTSFEKTDRKDVLVL